MSVTLGDYALREYPGRSTDVWRGLNPPLHPHTVVAHVVGRETTERTIDLMEQAVPTDDVAAVLVLGTEASIVPQADEDHDGSVDLPGSRVVLGAAAGAVVGILVIVALAVVWNLPWEAGLALMVFFGAAGAYAGVLSAGGARHAAERSVRQLHAPGEDIGVIAALLDDETAARAVAGRLSEAGIQDVRIVSRDGGWHAPD